MPILQFTPLQSQPSPSFFSALSALKLETLKLDESELPITGWVEEGRVVLDRQRGGEKVWVPGGVGVDGGAFGEGGLGKGMIPLKGVFKNFNTIEDFKKPDLKKEIFNNLVTSILESFLSPSPQYNPFLLLTFSDLKKYKFSYWFAFPTLVQDPAWEVPSEEEGGGVEVFEEVAELRRAKADAGVEGEGFLLRDGQVGEIKDFTTFFANTPEDQRTLVIHDPSPSPTSPTFLLRNILYYLSHHHSVTSLRVILLREGVGAARVMTVRLPGGVPAAQGEGKRPNAVGWEKNVKGVLASRVCDLGSTMDPVRLADQAIDLNLKLMRWRIMPSLDLEKIAGTKCLLLGAGTLGCYVARCLMGWGIRNITFVDSARVSYSNPVRQPLFEFEDCLDGGKPKAQCAADSLKRIYPGVNAKGVELSIPMPGHPIPSDPTSTAAAETATQTLSDLMLSHDATFLLMDSRESRWLPTLLGATHNKLIINAALGFDGYLVMRHGAGPEEGVKAEKGDEGGLREGVRVRPKRLGCYYCNDIVAPADSLTDRTLDQMCTVTRPGIAPIAAASAVELMVSLIQHPLGIKAPADLATPDSSDSPASAEPGSPLGLVPHQLRGFLGQWKTMLIEGAAYDRCTGCSSTVVDAYRSEGFPLLLRAFNEPDFLEQLTGLDKLYEEGEAVLEAVDWDESDEDGSM